MMTLSLDSIELSRAESAIDQIKDTNWPPDVTTSVQSQ
jgi:hypothetical protein